MPDHGIEYRDYQTRAVDRVYEEWAGGVSRTLLVLPTGTGKTVCGGMIAERALEEFGKPTLFVAHREILIRQAVRTIRGFGLDVAVEMAAENARDLAELVGVEADVVCGSVQTLQGGRLLRHGRDHFGCIVIDECHRAKSAMYRNLFEHFDARWVGITATADGGRDDVNLGSVFKTKAYEYPIRQAIREGWIAPIRTRTIMANVDLRGIKTTGKGVRDWNAGALAERIAPKVEEIAVAVMAEAGERQTVIFCPDVGSSHAMAEMLDALAGRKVADYVAGSGGRWGMPRRERKARLGDFGAFAYQYLVCCDLLFEGWDAPQVECVVVARPTRRRYRYMQMVGRATRPCPEIGKADCLVLDLDWTTDADAKDLCAVVGLFDDGDLPEPVVRAARERVRAGEEDAEKAVEEAKEEFRVRSRLLMRPAGVAAHYRVVETDPVKAGAVLADVTLKRKYDLDPKGNRNPASPEQIKYLHALGFPCPETLSKWGASKVIGKLEKRRAAGLAPVKDVGRLIASGMEEDIARSMTATAAAEALAALQKAAAPRPAAQPTLF